MMIFSRASAFPTRLPVCPAETQNNLRICNLVGSAMSRISCKMACIFFSCFVVRYIRACRTYRVGGLGWVRQTKGDAYYFDYLRRMTTPLRDISVYTDFVFTKKKGPS